MASGSGTFTFIFNVDWDGSVTVSPSARSIYNFFDDLGNILGLPRLPEERNAEYRQRIQDIYARVPGSSYEGLVFAATRGLGLSVEDAITITPASDLYGTRRASSPKVEVKANRVILYSAWQNEDTYTIDREINIYARSGDTYNGYYLSDLISAINESDYFSAAYANSGVDPRTFSSNLIIDSSNIEVESEAVKMSERFRLDTDGSSGGDIVSGTLFFSNDIDFSSVKSAEGSVSAAGDYYVDYNTGLIVMYRAPTMPAYCRYHYRDFPFTLKMSPVRVYNLADEDFMEEICESVTMESGIAAEGLLTQEGADIIDNIFDNIPFFWGD